MITTTAPQHISPLMAMLYPGASKRCDQCGGFVAMSAEEALRQWSEATYQPLVALSKALQDPMMASMTGLPTAIPATAPGYTYGGQQWAYGQPGYGHTHGHKHHHHKRHHDHGCGCGCEHRCDRRPCGDDDCRCRCYVVNADLVIYVRAGERRIVPLVIDNNRRRERHIRLELSDFASKGGSPTSVTSRLLSPGEFTLEPCQEQEVVMEIDVAQVTVGDEHQAGERFLDVDDCEVAYADLRIVGCDNRPIRIAVAILPRDCHAYRIDCSCGCC